MMKYFIECKTLDELKKEYRRLAMIHHPDVGGTVEAMQAINAEFEPPRPAAARPPQNIAANSTPPTAGRGPIMTPI